MKKITQHQGIFYQLYKNRTKDPYEYIPIWKLVGEVLVEEIGKWAFISYEVSARMSELKKDNPKLFEFEEVIGKTGARYLAYRIAIDVTQDYIEDPKLLAFYKLIKQK